MKKVVLFVNLMVAWVTYAVPQLTVECIPCVSYCSIEVHESGDLKLNITSASGFSEYTYSITPSEGFAYLSFSDTGLSEYSETGDAFGSWMTKTIIDADITELSMKSTASSDDYFTADIDWGYKWDTIEAAAFNLAWSPYDPGTTGQPLPGIIATLILGGGLLAARKRKMMKK